MKHIELKHDEYEITLLTKEEHKRYKNSIPLVNFWWWLRTSSSSQHGTASVNSVGGVNAVSSNVNYDIYAVRPVLKSNIINLPVGEKFSTLGNRWIVIDKWIAISEDVITHRRYDSKSSVWETSELKTWLEDWAKDGEING